MVDDPAPGPRRPTRRLAALACVAALPFSACGVRPVPPPHAPASPAASPMPGSVPAPPTAVATPAAPPPSSAPPVPPVPPAAPGPVRYPPEQVHGPFAPEMVERWRRLAETRPGRDDRMFLKAGASGTLNQHFFTCFAARARPFPPVEWGADAALASGAAWFHPPPGVRGRSDPFARRSRATEVSRTAGWALRGEPAPLETELEATDARFAVVAFGTNDMVMAGTPRAALTAYVNDLGRLVDRLLAAGTIPVVTGPGPRAHVPAIARWVRVFDAATRAIAEARQVPYLSLEVLHRPLVAAGLARDGMHANTYRSGTVARPCDFGPDGRQHGYNARNLETLRALDALRRSLAPGEVPAAPGPPPAPRLEGTGSRTTPFVVDALPFAHTGWLAAGGEPATYTLTLSEGQPRGLRVELVTARAAGFALDARGPGEPGRGPRFVQGTLAPGRWTFEVRRPMPPAAPHDRGARDYLLLIVPCDAGDPDCR